MHYHKVFYSNILFGSKDERNFNIEEDGKGEK
jgi:hypothetical protein